MTEQKQRPAFLTVLCILTWVGSGFVIISQLISLATSSVTKEVAGLAEENLQDAMNQISSESPATGSIFSKFMGQGMYALDHLKELALARILGVIVVLIGSFLMWKLKKVGFYTFVVGKIIVIAGILIIMGGSGFGALMIIGPVIVAIAFIAMYAINLKAMS